MKPDKRIDVSKLYWQTPYDHQITLKVLRDFGLPDDSMVHASHCKIESGCKYGGHWEDPMTCPVCDGRVKQIFDYDPEWD